MSGDDKSDEIEDVTPPDKDTAPKPVSRRRMLGDKLTDEERAKCAPKPGNYSPAPLVDGPVNSSRWLEPARDADRVKLNDNMKELFCEKLLAHGKKVIAAREIGVHPKTVENHIKNDPVFAEAVDSTLKERAQNIVNQLETEALKGHTKLTYDKETGALVAEEIKFETPLRSMILKRFDPDYKDRSEIDINVRGGVIVVPGRLTPEAWEAIFSPKTDPTQGEE